MIRRAGSLAAAAQDFGRDQDVGPFSARTDELGQVGLEFAAGIRDRWAALGAWYIWTCLLGRNPLIANPSIPYVGWMLLAHACLPKTPYRLWPARGRPDAGDNWTFPQPIFVAA